MTTSDTRRTLEVGDWCVARGVVEPGARPMMEAALAGSEAGKRSVGLFERVASLARRDREAEVPDYAVRVVKAVAGLARLSSGRETASGGRPSLLRFLPCRLTFDSCAAAQTGTRDLPWFGHRMVSYRTRDFSVHVKLEQETSPHGQVVVGQLLRHGPDPRPAPQVPVLLLSGGRVVGRSLTSRFGEFQADDLPPGQLEICLLVGEDCIGIRLGASSEDA